MRDYMKKAAQKGAQQNNAAPIQAKTNGIPNSVLNDVFAGKRHADSSMMGHSQNLAPSIAAKMSRAFGMDLTGMQVYQSDAMKDTGMQGMAQGNKVVLSSDVDLNTTAGQAVLGHEISHIHAQSQGVGMGHSGLYENAALEHQADTEGLLAAQGRSIYQGGMDAGIGMSYGLGMRGVEGLTPLSGGMSAGAGAPMQAKKGGVDISKIPQDKKDKWIAEYLEKHGEHMFDKDREVRIKVPDDIKTKALASGDPAKYIRDYKTEQYMMQSTYRNAEKQMISGVQQIYQKEENPYRKHWWQFWKKKKEKDPFEQDRSF